MDQDTGIRLIYTTTEEVEQARTIGRELVARRLAACINILSPMISIYPWDSEVQEGSETVMIAKTRWDLVDDAIQTIISLHDYECPCVLALPVSGGHADFLDWILSETRPEESLSPDPA